MARDILETTSVLNDDLDFKFYKLPGRLTRSKLGVSTWEILGSRLWDRAGRNLATKLAEPAADRLRRIYRWELP
jgi:hypothetical protein